MLTLLFQILSNLTSSPSHFVALFLWLRCWSSHILRVFLLHDIIDLHMSSHGTLVSQGPCGVFDAKTHQFSEVYCMPWFFVVLWFDIKYTNTYTNEGTQHTQGLIDGHIYFMLTPPVMCSQQLSVFHLMNNLLISKIYITQCFWLSSTMSLLCKNYWLVETTYLLIRFNKTKFFQ